MAIGLALFFLLGCFTLLFLMRQWLRRQGARPGVQGAFSLVVIFGSVCGVWLSLRFQYPVGPSLRFAGAPLPLVIIQKENDRWIDYPHPRPAMALLLMANAALTATALAGPLVFWQAISKRSSTSAP